MTVARAGSIPAISAKEQDERERGTHSRENDHGGDGLRGQLMRGSKHCERQIDHGRDEQGCGHHAYRGQVAERPSQDGRTKRITYDHARDLEHRQPVDVPGSRVRAALPRRQCRAADQLGGCCRSAPYPP